MYVCKCVDIYVCKSVVNIHDIGYNYIVNEIVSSENSWLTSRIRHTGIYVSFITYLTYVISEKNYRVISEPQYKSWQHHVYSPSTK